MLLMLSRLKILVVLVLVALMPLRALASVTIGFCASGHQEQPVAAHGAHGDHAHRGADDQQGKPVAPTCNICAEHCSSAAFAPDGAARAVAAPAVSEARTGVAVRAAPAFVHDRLDRPPLA